MPAFLAGVLEDEGGGDVPVPDPEPEPVPDPEPGDDELAGTLGVVALVALVPDVMVGPIAKVVGQVKLKAGVVDRLDVMANLTSFAGLASSRVYQKVGTLPNRI